jgi:hypothetical protein
VSPVKYELCFYISKRTTFFVVISVKTSNHTELKLMLITAIIAIILKLKEFCRF